MNFVIVLFAVTLLKESLRLRRECNVGENVLIAVGAIAQLLLGFLKAGLQQVGIALGNGFFVAQHQLLHFGVDFARSAAILAFNVGFDFLGNILIASAGQHIYRGLNTDHLAHGRNERRITEILAYLRYLQQNGVNINAYRMRYVKTDVDDELGATVVTLAGKNDPEQPMQPAGAFVYVTPNKSQIVVAYGPGQSNGPASVEATKIVGALIGSGY